MTAEKETNVAPNAHRFLWLGFMAIVASGVGFSIRGGILGDWGHEFGFTQTELGQITGGGLLGFGVIVLLGAVLAEAAGYGKLMAVAFLDTSYLLALEIENDQNHQLAARHWRRVTKSLPQLVTTSFVLDEVVTFFNSRG